MAKTRAKTRPSRTPAAFVCWADAVDGLRCSRVSSVYFAMTCVLDLSAPQQRFGPLTVISCEAGILEYHLVHLRRRR